MPAEGVQQISHDEILRIEEIATIARIASDLGIRRIRLTGGEPLVRRGIEDLIYSLSSLDSIESVALTTNGILLSAKAEALKQAGLSRVNISLDTLDPQVFSQITRGGSLDKVREGIDAAFAVGFDPIKLNVVTTRSLDQDFFAFAKLSLDRPLHVRFIECMPIGAAGSEARWSSEDVIPSSELIEHINNKARSQGIGPLHEVVEDKPVGWGPARYYRFDKAFGTVGFISPLSNHFCAQCNRLRMTADGQVRPCLFSDQEFDAKTALRRYGEEGVRKTLSQALASKPDEHHFRVGTLRQMSQIGG